MSQEYIPGGSLKSLIEKFGRLDEAVVRTYSRQLLLGLEYLHRCGIAHRDIKVCLCVCVCVCVCLCVCVCVCVCFDLLSPAYSIK